MGHESRQVGDGPRDVGIPRDRGGVGEVRSLAHVLEPLGGSEQPLHPTREPGCTEQLQQLLRFRQRHRGLTEPGRRHVDGPGERILSSRAEQLSLHHLPGRGARLEPWRRKFARSGRVVIVLPEGEGHLFRKRGGFIDLERVQSCSDEGPRREWRYGIADLTQ